MCVNRKGSVPQHAEPVARELADLVATAASKYDKYSARNLFATIFYMRSEAVRLITALYMFTGSQPVHIHAHIQGGMLLCCVRRSYISRDLSYRSFCTVKRSAAYAYSRY